MTKFKKELNRTTREDIHSQIQQINAEKNRLKIMKYEEVSKFNSTMGYMSKPAPDGPIKQVTQTKIEVNFYN